MKQRGRTLPKQKLFVRKQDRATVKWVVALHTGTNTATYKKVHGTTRNMVEHEMKEYTNRAGKVAQGFSEDEYVAFLKELFPEVDQPMQLRGSPGPLALVHDRDPVHLTKKVAEFLQKGGIVNCVLPPRSPDLDPLDYCIFANAKKAAGRRDVESLKDFKDQCAAFEAHIAHLDVAHQTKGYKSRLLRVIEEEGGHI